MAKTLKFYQYKCQDCKAEFEALEEIKDCISCQKKTLKEIKVVEIPIGGSGCGGGCSECKKECS